jgi:hypothetical protein
MAPPRKPGAELKDGSRRSRKSRENAKRKKKRLTCILRHAPDKWLERNNKRWMLRTAELSVEATAKLSVGKIPQPAKANPWRTAAAVPLLLDLWNQK